MYYCVPMDETCIVCVSCYELNTIIICNIGNKENKICYDCWKMSLKMCC